MSIARVYSLNVSMTSGARYHLCKQRLLIGGDDKKDCNTYLVATYSVMKVLLSLAAFGGLRAERARPKSQIYCAHIQTTRMLLEERQACFEIAIGVKQKVGWFEVAMKNIC